MTPHETDLILDRTLRALGNADPAPGFTRRLNAHLAQSAATQPARPNRLFFKPSHQVLALGIAALLCTLTVLHHHHASKRNTRQNISVLPSAKPTTTPSNLTASTLKPQQQPPIQTAHTTRPASIPARAPDPADDLDTQALNDLHTPSFPPPSLPPTPQERLVLLMLRRGEKHDLAQLDPAIVDAFSQHERTAFREFFDPSPQPETVTNPNQNQADTGPTPVSSTPTQPSSPGDPQ